MTLGYLNKVILRSHLFSLKKYSYKVLRAQIYPSSSCPSIHGTRASSPSLSLQFRPEEAGQGLCRVLLKAASTGHYDFCFQASQIQIGVLSVHPGGQQFKHWLRTVCWQVCDKGRTLKSRGCRRTAELPLLPEGEVPAFYKCSPVQGPSVSSLALFQLDEKSCLCQLCQMDTA